MPDTLSKTVFLVSGGARGITAACVIALAEARGGTFLLVGRTPLERVPGLDDHASETEQRRQIASLLSARGERATPLAVEKMLRGVRARQEIHQTLARIERVGGRARYLAVDVTDAAALRQAVAASGITRVTGILHGAGTIADKRIENKTEQDIAAVYATKVRGLRAMLSCVDEASLAYLALFSSTSGFYGNVGQADYAAANEILNKVGHAFARRFPACRTVVFDWGPWDGGMVTPFLKTLFASQGVPVMPVEAGARVFVEQLCRERSPVQILVNDTGPPPSQPAAASAPVVRASSYRVARTLTAASNPFLRDHVIGGHAVLPAACAGLWMANVCQRAAPGYRFVAVADFRVLKGLVFDAGAAERYLLSVEDEEISPAVIVQTVVITSSTPEQKPRYHYRGKVVLARTPPQAPEPRRYDLTPDPRFAAFKPYAEGALFHGPTFQGVLRVVRLEKTRITVACRPPMATPEVLGQFAPLAFDAVALDVQVQCLGLWAHHVLGAAALPTSWARYEVFGALPTNGFYVTAEIEAQSGFAVRAGLFVHDAAGNVFARALGVELTVHRPGVLTQAASTNPGDRAFEPKATAAPERPNAIADANTNANTNTNAGITFERRGLVRALREVERPSFVVKLGARLGLTRDRRRVDEARARGELLAELAPLPPSRFGAASFLRDHGVACAYMAGAMAKGIATEELVIALGRAGFLGTFGAGGLPLDRIEQAVVNIARALPTQPYAFNLLHSPRKLATEDATVDVYLKHRVRTVEASSYIDLTPSIVRYRAAGLSRRPDGTIAIANRVIVKLSRVELARRFLLPPPGSLVQALVEGGRLSREQGELALHVALADDVTVEADSGGHTDNRPLVALLPAMIALRDEIQRERRYRVPIRVGAAGGIATPQAIVGAFAMGADYVVTGSINQACVESGASHAVKQLLASLQMTDIAMSPESDLFEHGIRVQVVKQRTLFPMRAQKLYHCYQTYESLEAIPEAIRRQLEQQIFKAPLDTIWQETARYLAAHKPEQLAQASDPKVRMALLFKWYLGQSSRWAIEGTPGRELDYQIWCGPAMGAFNAWARGTYLESAENRRVADVARVLMEEAAYLHRVQQLRLAGLADDLLQESAS